MQSPQTTTSAGKVEAAENTQRIKTAIAAADAPYLRPNQAIEVLPVSRRTLSNWQRRHVIPFYRVGRTIMFKRSDLESALERFRVSATGEADYATKV